MGRGDREAADWVTGGQKFTEVTDNAGEIRGEGNQTRRTLISQKRGGLPICNGEQGCGRTRHL